jgi:hypothetical protein
MPAVPPLRRTIRRAGRWSTARFCWSLIVLSVSVAGALAAADPALTINASSTLVPMSLQRTLDEVQLRGYGTVSGRMWNCGVGCSVLEIRCESEDRAKLTQAKYLSDLQLLPGVEAGTLAMTGPRWGAAPLSLQLVKDQGVVMALRAASTLYIVAAPDLPGLQKLLDGAFTGSAAGAASSAQVTVPMWLDRFDRHGFRFYYAPFTLPPPERMADGAKPASYDFTKDFTFAKENGAGLVLWSTQSMQSSSEGVTNANWWGWVERWAEPLGLPLGINLSAYNYDLPNWVANRFRSQLAQPMPHYLGDSMSIAGQRGTGGKVGELAWGATAARDAMFGSLQQLVRRFAAMPNVVSWLEPHGEFYQGGDAFMGYGPAVDATFRDYLMGRYHTVAALNAAWLAKLPSIDAVKAPELAEFAGWNGDAIDLAGSWRVGYPKDAPHDAWFGAGFDDAAWSTVVAPGDDHAFFIPRESAVYRRTVEVPAARLGAAKRWWIYLWDLNTAWDKPVSIWLNGRKLGESPCRHPQAHWMVAEATAALQAGANQLSVGVPNGYIGYRIYLSPVEPRQYPALGQGMNAKWVDYVDWREYERMASARRGVEMIREVDPNRQIDFMAPAESADGLKGLAEGYGGNFKDTGFMAGVWAELLPSLMRGSRLPFSLEPGGPPRTVPEMRRMLGLYHCEAIQAMDYFIHIGDVEWNPEIRQAFTQTLPLWHAFGKYHCHPADLAILWHMHIGALTGFPWGGDLNTNTWSGWACRQVPESLLESHPRDGISESDFARGNAAAYKVVIDTNTSIMSDDLLAQIERYVRGGGIFITTGQSGRHSPIIPDSWPICALSGYQVLTHETFPPETNGGPPLPPPPGSPGQGLAPAPGQPVYTAAGEWMKDHYLTGLHLKRVASDAQDLLLWKDGSVAVGMRQLGKGRIIQFGCKEPGGGMRIKPEAFFPILDWAGVRRNQAAVSVSCADDAKYARGCLYREYVSNNGLYDVWMLFNDNREHAVEAAITFKERMPNDAYDVLSGAMVQVQGGRLAGITLAPLETRMFLTRRNLLAQAPADWFDLQRSWWRGTTPVSHGFPAPSTTYRHPLDDAWSWRMVGEQDQPEAWASPAFDASGWMTMALGIVSSPQQPGIRHVALRKTITVPAAWSKGRVSLSLRSTGYPDFAGSGRLWLDGKLMQNWGAEAVDQVGEDVLGAGSTHTLQLEIRAEGAVVGMPGDAWLSYIPEPQQTIDLAGTWATAPDMLHFNGEVKLPGPYSAKVLRRTVAVPKALLGRTAVVTLTSTRAFGLIVNGTYIPFSGGPAKNGNVMAITPFLRYGEDNLIELVSPYDHCEVRHVSLDFYDPALAYP